jgi:hypothetical protein
LQRWVTVDRQRNGVGSLTRSSFFATSDHASVDSESFRELMMFFRSEIVEVSFRVGENSVDG